MPLAATLQPVDVGFKRKRLDGRRVAVSSGSAWTTRIACDTMCATARSAGRGSFFSTCLAAGARRWIT